MSVRLPQIRQRPAGISQAQCDAISAVWSKARVRRP